jgi:hypothetical protein
MLDVWTGVIPLRMGTIRDAKVGIACAIALAVIIALVAVVAHLRAGGWSAPPWPADLPPAVRQRVSGINLPAECRLDNLPKAFEYDAVGVYQGTRTDFKPDPPFAGMEFVGAIDVKVTATKRPVVLLLSSYAPAVWKIKAAAGVEIAGIAYSGYGPAIVQGDLPPAGKIIELTPQSKCGAIKFAYAYDGDGFRKLQSLAVAVAGARLSTFQGRNDNGSFVVGPGARHLGDLGAARAELQNVDKSDTRNAKLQSLIDQGAVRLATGDELFAWVNADPELAPYGLVRKPNFARPAYMILKPFAFPEGMTGADGATFILPKGMPKPSGDAGHNVVLKMDASDGCIALSSGSVCTPP